MCFRRKNIRLWLVYSVMEVLHFYWSGIVWLIHMFYCCVAALFGFGILYMVFYIYNLTTVDQGIWK